MSTKKNLKRRDFIGNISKLSLLGVVGFNNDLNTESLKNLAADPEKGHVFLCNPYLQAPDTDSITIMWITNKYCYSWVEYGEGENLNIKAQTSTDGLIDAYNRINKIQLKNLKPNTQYSYKVFSKEIVQFNPYKITYGKTIESEIKKFTTIHPNAETVSWLVMNDIHDRPQSIKDLMQLNKEAFDYVFFNGDMFDYQNDEQQIIDHMLQPCSDNFAQEKPFLFVRGNHETRGKFSRNVHEYYDSPSGKFYYTYQWGPVFHIVLDTGEDKPDEHEVYGGIVDFDSYREEQAAWFEKIAKTKAFKKAPFRVVMMHIPHFHSDEWHGTTHCRKLFAPLFNKYKIDLFIAGHTHKYGIYHADNTHDYPIFIGGGPKNGNRTLISVKANSHEMHVKMLLDDGKEIGSNTIKSRSKSSKDLKPK